MNHLVDTNVLSEIVRPRPSAAVVEWLGARERVAVSVITVEEVAFGLARKPNAAIERWFEQFFQRRCDVLPVTREIAEQCGALRAHLSLHGRPRTQADMLIAATARVRGLALATRNVRDFGGCGLTVVNPFAP